MLKKYKSGPFYRFLSFLFFLSFMTECSKETQTGLVNFETDHFKTSISEKGYLLSFKAADSNTEYQLKDSLNPIMSLRIENEYLKPKQAKYNDNILTLDFGNAIKAELLVSQNPSYLSLELLSLSNVNFETLDLVLWGPYTNKINGVIGETVGVVRDSTFAMGIQSLNIKTLGGYPWNESDRMPAFDIFDQEDPTDLHPENVTPVLYRVEAAKPVPGGSSLQAYTRNRMQSRLISDFNHEKILAPPYDDGGVIGSKIALFGVPVDKVLKTIGTIEVEEGLPHPMIDGEWVKTKSGVNASYMIMSFTESDFDKALNITSQAGLNYLYYYGKTFESWGHFELDKKYFPKGYATIRSYVEKAKEKGIRLGTHTLSNFISPNDPYVTPIPDKRLAKVGSSVLTQSIDNTQNEILIESPDFFNQMKNNTLKTVRIEEELIRYGSVSLEAPWKLLDCQRGAFNTKPKKHEKGVEISKLLDHAYKVFLTDADLTIEMSKNIANLYNQTGLSQISFDGLEGNRSTGLGTYGESLMPYVWFNNLNPEIRKHLIIDASRTTHFFWHIFTRMNWGEPWYAGFRESQTAYRLKNQNYFQRNYMPGMLGWFKMTSETSLEDIEWLLARSAGFDAGFAFVTGFKEVAENGNSKTVLSKIADWEKLRLGGAFSKEQKQLMQNTEKEFSIRKKEKNQWDFYQMYSGKFIHDKKIRQPGEPVFSTFKVDNIGDQQALQFIISPVETSIGNIKIEIDQYKEVSIPIQINVGQILKYDGDSHAILYNKNWQEVSRISVSKEILTVSKGTHTLNFSCTFNSDSETPKVKVEIRFKGKPEQLSLAN